VSRPILGDGRRVVQSRLSLAAVHDFEPVDLDEAEDFALCRQADAITPSRARLDALIDRPPPSSICSDDEDDELPC
jgi:hypothetical protein